MIHRNISVEKNRPTEKEAAIALNTADRKARADIILTINSFEFKQVKDYKIVNKA